MVKNKDFTMAFKKLGKHVPLLPIPPDTYARNIRQMLKSG